MGGATAQSTERVPGTPGRLRGTRPRTLHLSFDSLQVTEEKEALSQIVSIWVVCLEICLLLLFLLVVSSGKDHHVVYALPVPFAERERDSTHWKEVHKILDHLLLQVHGLLS